MRAVSRRRLLVAMAFGILGAIVAIALDSAIAYLREDWSNPVGIVLVAGVAAISGVLPLLRPDRSRGAPQGIPGSLGGTSSPGMPQHPHGAPVPPYGSPPVASRPARRGVPLLVGVLVMLLLCGGGVGAATFGARYIGGWITGDEVGFDVLAEERSATAGDLTLTVHRVEVTSHFTHVELSAANAGTNSLRLPIFGYCQLTPSGDRRTLDGDAFRSDWPELIPPGQTVRGIVTFPRIPDGVESISISFGVIFGQFGDTSITVADIPLT